MALLSEVQKEYGKIPIYIDGKFRDSETDEWMDVMNPAKGEVIAKVPFVTVEEVDEAVESAARAFEKWRETPVPTRVQYLFRMKEAMERHKEELARLIAQNHGKTIDESRGEVRRAIENIETAIGVAYILQKGEQLDDIARGIDEYLIREPLGVAAILAPFNFPIMVPFWFIPYALAVGDTVVVKPSEITPVPFYWVNKILHEEVKLPPGVVNIVYGRAKQGSRLVEHKDVFGVAFVGSTKVARILYEQVGKLGKKSILQASAKNFAVVMPDAKMDMTVTNLISSFFGNTGQRCLANSILLPVGDAYDKIVPKFIELAKQIKMGYGLDEDTDMGPMTTKQGKEKVLYYIEKGIEEGAKLVLDGRDKTVPEYPNGYWVGPTIFENVSIDMTIAQEEIFGPVASIMRAENLDEAIELVNSVKYGNASSIFTSDGRTARIYRRKVKAGNIGVNIGIAAPMAFFPFGGMKESFFGIVHGQIDSLDFFTDKKVVIVRWW